MPAMHRILQIGLGPLGRRLAADAVERGIAETIAGIDPDPGASHGVPFPVWRTLAEVERPERFDVAIVSTVSDLARCAPTLRPLLERGMAVVSTCEELSFPWLRHRELAAELDAIARKGGGRLLGTGVNPGFLMDTVPVFVTAVCKRVRRIEVHRIQDATSRRIPFQRKIGAGLTPAEFERKAGEGTLRHVGLGESLHFISHYTGLAIDDWSETLEPVMGDGGLAAGVRQVARGTRGGQSVIELVFVAAMGQADPHDRVIVDAEPPVDVVFRGGVHGDLATSAVVMSAIDRLCAAAPGLHTMATIPIAASP